MSRTLKDILNDALGESGFLQKDAFASSGDPDDIQMVAFANRAAREMRRFFPWNKLRKTGSITMNDGRFRQSGEPYLEYDLPADFDKYVTESMWKDDASRGVVIPTSDEYWGFIKAGSPGTDVAYHAKIIGGQLAFTGVTHDAVVNFDYCSRYAITDSGNNTKERFTADTDLFLLDEDTLILGIKAYWKMEKEMPTAIAELKDFRRSMKRDIGADTPAKVIRPAPLGRRTGQGPVSQDYKW